MVDGKMEGGLAEILECLLVDESYCWNFRCHCRMVGSKVEGGLVEILECLLVDGAVV